MDVCISMMISTAKKENFLFWRPRHHTDTYIVYICEQTKTPNACDTISAKMLYINVHMDIQSPIQSLKQLFQKETQTDLCDFDMWLQNGKVLEPKLPLISYCESGHNLTQANAEIFRGNVYVNIADALKPSVCHPLTMHISSIIIFN